MFGNYLGYFFYGKKNNYYFLTPTLIFETVNIYQTSLFLKKKE